MHEVLSEAELKDRFPKLARARELYIKLFADLNPLRNLGYSPNQIAYTLPVISMLQETGSVVSSEKSQWKSWLRWLGPPEEEQPEPEFDLLVLEFLNQTGYNLIGSRGEIVRAGGDYHRANLWQLLQQPVILDSSGDVVRIALLFPESVDHLDLNLIVETIYGPNSPWNTAYPKLARSRALTSLTTHLGLSSTYEATWTDERTKLEFALKLNSPGLTQYQVWRRLNSITDTIGTVFPFGQKANISRKNVLDTLTFRQNYVAQGSLLPGTANI